MNEPSSQSQSSMLPPGSGSDTPATADHNQVADESQVDASGTVDFTAGLPSAPRTIPAAQAIPGYETLDVLGRGGMGVVYKARQVRLKRLVALKMILRGAQAGPEDVERFRLEAEAVARLQHPNIVQIHEVGEHDGMPFFSLELVDGGSLHQKLAGTPLPSGEAAALVEALARAMHVAHQHGIIHRDLKPVNVLLTKDGVPKIADFGLAKQVEADSGQTQTGQILGTPSYMAPEQAAGDGKTLSPAADTYALGAILYETLTGRPPFKAARLLDTLEQVRTQEPVAPRQLQPHVPRDLETICLKCLQKDPSKRYDTAEELADDLQRFQKGEPIRARPVGGVERLGRWCRRNPLVACLAAALFTVLVTGLALVSWKWQEALDNADNEAAAKLQAISAEANARTEGANARMAEAVARAERRKTQRQLAVSRLEQGLALCQRNDVNQGLFVIASALPEAMQADDRELEWSIRTQIAEWAQSLRPLRAVVPDLANGNCVSLSADGRILLSVSKDGTLQRWDATTGEPVGPPRTLPAGKLQLAAFSAKGDYVFLMPFLRKSHLWDVEAGRVKSASIDHLLHTRPVVFSPDGAWLATCSVDRSSTSREEYVQVWTVPTGLPHTPKLMHPNWVTAFAVSPDSKTLLTGCSDGKARLWDIPSGKLVVGPLSHGGDIRHVAFHADGKLLSTAGAGGSVLVWSAATGKLAGTLSGPENADLIYHVAETRGRYLAGGNKGEARLWVPGAKKGGKSSLVSRTLPHGHGAAVASVAFSPDGDTAISGASYHWSSRGEARLWDGVSARALGPALPHRGHVASARYVGDGAFILVEGKEEARLWQAQPQKSRGAPLRHDATVFRGGFSPDGRMFLTLSGSTVRLWDTDTGRLISTLPHADLLKSATFSPDGKTIATADFSKNEVRLWDVATAKPRGDPLTHADMLVAIAFSPDSKTIVTTCTDRTLSLWDTTTGKGLGERVTFLQSIWAAEFSPDGRTLLLGGPDERASHGEVRFWDIATRQYRGTPLPHPAPVNQLTFSQDGRTLLAVCLGSSTDAYQVCLWDAHALAPRGAPLLHQGKIAQAVFSADGKTIATASQDLTVRLWSASTGQPLGAVLPHPTPVLAVAFSADGRRLVTAAADGLVRQWEAGSGRMLGAPITHRGVFSLFALHPDGKLLLTGGVDQTARIWHLPPPVNGDVDQIVCWLQVLTGTELDEHGSVHLLDSATWRARRSRLKSLGGSVDGEKRDR